MLRKGIIGFAAVLLLFGAVGCKKKEPDTAPVIKTTEVEPEEPPAAPEPMVQDETPDPLAGDLVEANAHARESGLLGDVFYDFDRYELKPEARERLSKNAKFLMDHPEFIVTIEGHCDERGTNEYNLALGERRAAAALDYMASLGIARNRMRPVSYGEERPFCDQSNEACWSQNRRGHFTITGRTN